MIVVGPDLHESAIHDVPYSWNGHTGFCDIGGQDDSPGILVLLLLEDPVLVFMWKCRVEHQDLEI